MRFAERDTSMPARMNERMDEQTNEQQQEGCMRIDVAIMNCDVPNITFFFLFIASAAAADASDAVSKTGYNARQQ